ncbi:MAG: TIGR04255 family protein [Chloroflexi bacterium]|nr:TIGR04255 family protein [Chloroflexota bacterium]
MAGRTPPFPNPPLVLTVLEIRYPKLAEGFGESARRQMAEAVRDHLPLLESVVEEQVNVSVEGPVPVASSIEHQQRTVPRFSTRDRATALLVKPDALVIETTAYAGWLESFRPLVAEVLHAIERISQPNGVLRIGLRYIDEIRVPSIESAPGDWRGYIDKHLLAAADPGFIPASLRPSEWLGVVQYQTAPDSMLTVRYGPQSGYAVNPAGPTRRRDPRPAGLFFLLDSDSSWHGATEVPEFRADWICERCDLLHRPVSEFFRIVVTDRLCDEVFNRQEAGQP